MMADLGAIARNIGSTSVRSVINDWPAKPAGRYTSPMPGVRMITYPTAPLMGLAYTANPIISFITYPSGAAPMAQTNTTSMVVDNALSTRNYSVNPIVGGTYEEMSYSSPLAHARIIGEVFDANSQPLERRVIALNATYQVVGSTLSDATTGKFVMLVSTSSAVTVIAVPSDIDGRNALIFHKVLPIPV